MQLTVLGKPEIKREGQPLADLVSAKDRALLIYLAATGKSYSRSTLAGLLWGEVTEERARANLRMALSRLRQSVGNYLTISRQAVEFNSELPHWLDVAEFEAGTSSMAQSQAEPLRAALALYRGDFLEDFYVRHAPAFEEWVLVERERLRLLALRALSHLTRFARQEGDIQESIQLTRRMLVLEPWQEEAHRQLMWLLAHNGQRSAALAQFEICRRLLAEELDVGPATETVNLYEQIKREILDLARGREQTALGTWHPSSPAHLDAQIRHNLPPQLTHFIGREIELAQVADLLAKPDCRLLNLVGPGGIGKTRLALTAAEAQMDRFKDGVRFVSLVGIAPSPASEAIELLLANIANALGYTFSAQQPPRDLLLNFLADKEVLLLLDNFEGLLSAPLAGKRRETDLLADILRFTTDVKILVTSRQRLGIEAEWLLDINGLPYAPADSGDHGFDYPAGKLFAQSALRLKPDLDLAAEQTAVNRICRLVEGSPLGIELAASWVRVLPCAEIVTRLEAGHSPNATTGLDILKNSSLKGRGRHESMRVVLDYSWKLLGEEEQRVFRRLSTFHEGFTFDAAAQVTEATLPVLAGLADKSWLRQSKNGRYHIHELVRQYAAGQMAAYRAEETITRQKHCRFYADFLEARRAFLEDSPDQGALAELDSEVENIRWAWEWVSTQGDAGAIASYLEGLWGYYRQKGWFQEAVPVLEHVCAMEPMSDLEKARWQRWLGEAHYQMGHLSESRENWEQVMTLLGQPLPAGRAGWMLTILAQMLIQVSHRLWFGRIPGRSSERARHRLEGVRALVQLVQAYILSEQKMKVLGAALSGLNLAERSGSFAEVAPLYGVFSLTMLGVPSHRFVRFYGRLAHEQLPNINRLPAKAFTLEVLGINHFSLCEWSEAKEALDVAATLWDQFELRRNWAQSEAILGYIAYHQGQFSASMERFTGILAPAVYLGDTTVQHWALLGQAECALRIGHIHADNVMFILEKAKAVPKEHLGLTDLTRLNGVLAWAYLYLGKPEHAQQSAQAALQLIDQSSFFTFWTIEGYAGPAEVFLALWERTATDDQAMSEKRMLSQSARQACRAMDRFSQIFLFGRPRAWLYKGLYAWLAGNSDKARRFWRKSLTLAEQMEMPYEQGRAHYELGRHLLAGDPARQDHLCRACEIFSKLDAAYDLTRAREAIKPLS